MKKKYLTLTVCLIVITVIAAVTFYISLFYVGDARGGDILYIDRVAVTKALIQLDGGTASSGEAYKNYEYTIKGEDLYITINYVLVSKAYHSGNFSIKIKDDQNRVTRIYLDDGENKKLIWQNNPAANDIPPASPDTPAKTAIILQTGRITSGDVEDGRTGGVLQYQLTTDELRAFIDYFNGRKFMEDDKKEGSTDHDSLSDSTDVILQMEGEKKIHIMGYLDGETVIVDDNGGGYSLYDPDLTDFLTATMGGILREKGAWN